VSAEEGIRATIDMLADAWNRNDMTAFASLFTDDATYVSGTGRWLRGRQAIREGLSNEQAGGGDGRVVITGISINLIKADVAVVHNTWEMTGGSDQKGESLQSRKGVITQVLVSDGERWQIAALQNTDLDDQITS